VGDCGRKCKEMAGEGEEMREKIIEIMLHWNCNEVAGGKWLPEIVDQILALFKDSELKWYNAGWEDAMKEKVKK